MEKNFSIWIDSNFGLICRGRATTLKGAHDRKNRILYVDALYKRGKRKPRKFEIWENGVTVAKGEG